MKRLKLFAVLLLLAGIAMQPVYSQDFQEDLQQMAEVNAKHYVSPLATGIGMSLNSGVYRTAKVHKLFGFDVAINVAGFVVPEDETTFNVELPDLEFEYEGQSITLSGNELYGGTEGEGPEVSNFFGDKGSEELQPDENYARSTIADAIGEDENSAIVTQIYNNNVAPLIAPGGIGIRYGLFPSAQVAVGLPMGTEVQLRYSPPIEMPRGMGEFSVFGAGARISIDQFIPIPLFPVDIATGLFFQKTEIGPVSVNNALIHAEVSRSLPIVTFYGGLAYENSSMDVDYTIDLDGESALDGTNVNFTIDGDNAFRATIGARFKFLIFNLNTDYSIGAYNAATLGLGVSFR